nr:hypothetical protein [Deltaproteobacteria bacterium]
MRAHQLLLPLGLALASACSSNESVVGGDAAADLGALDLGADAPDEGTTDVGTADAGTPDAGTPDAGTPDAGTPGTRADLDASADAGADAGADVPVDRGPMCSTPQVVCGDRCVTTANDPAHCGACGNACRAGEVCAEGSCRIACPAGQSVCGASCVTLDRDPQHCGRCDTACGAGASCEMGTCRCPSGQALCGDRCVDTATATSHCGLCGRACALAHATQACVAGACRVAGCEAGFGDCDGMADNGCETAVAANLSHCGACGRVCAPAHATASCAAGACAVAACEAGYADCDAMAANGCEVDARSDARNCGACGTTCLTGVCAAGRCVAPRSCLELKTLRPASTDGRYTIDPDGAGGAEALEVYCDMTTAGGGWTYVATVTNNGDAANAGRWLMSSPTPNAWESATATFGMLDPSANQDYRSLAFASVAARAVMITHRNLFLLATDDGCLQGRSLQASLTRLDWTCGGSEVFTRHPDCTHACVIASATPRAGDTALLNGVTRARLYLKAGEADGAQDTNRDRAYLSTSYRDNVDYPTGLGAFCSGSSCSPRTGEADVNDRSDAITPSAGSEFYGLWVR